MKIKESKARTSQGRSGRQLSFESLATAEPEGSFHAALADCKSAAVHEREYRQTSKEVLRRVQLSAWQRLIIDALKRGWALLQAKYKTSTTKRLRVSETISLGEKRFVAIVAVEGREFLIGGGVSGMSLLAQLGATETMTGNPVQNFVDGGGVL